MDNDLKNILWAVGTTGIALVTWLFTKGGIRAISSWRITNIEESRKKETEERLEEKAETKHLKDTIERQNSNIVELNKRINDIESELRITQDRLRLMQLYFDEVIPQGSAFAKKLSEMEEKIKK